MKCKGDANGGRPRHLRVAEASLCVLRRAFLCAVSKRTSDRQKSTKRRKGALAVSWGRAIVRAHHREGRIACFRITRFRTTPPPPPPPFSPPAACLLPSVRFAPAPARPHGAQASGRSAGRASPSVARCTPSLSVAFSGIRRCVKRARSVQVAPRSRRARRPGSPRRASGRHPPLSSSTRRRRNGPLVVAPCRLGRLLWWV